MVAFTWQHLSGVISTEHQCSAVWAITHRSHFELLMILFIVLGDVRLSLAPANGRSLWGSLAGVTRSSCDCLDTRKTTRRKQSFHSVPRFGIDLSFRPPTNVLWLAFVCSSWTSRPICPRNPHSLKLVVKITSILAEILLTITKINH